MAVIAKPDLEAVRQQLTHELNGEKELHGTLIERRDRARDNVKTAEMQIDKCMGRQAGYAATIQMLEEERTA